ncbi:MULTISPECIES: hypothetical protein [unclassified Clostridioides]|uniref:hypothetical protein n=1 Tax=unclassified Clostridioides TaxID=2635829 RepID=UPI001D10A619|nr:hypothetical protein [Clostridioides sp. ZZV15-6388]MCC0644491.1 hypothetical protein [Clostridioides sp. ZZV14-6150]MCC0663739.1 hypothetical protein [Clostridioides sp. ZZV15-6597]MCC0719446.1 hypothetical protein [Clostridioides sp. ZZV14-6105]MCC0723795.1 hypothetical protein [Clostridioides sp. ZZV14-6104]MCC0752114.1 hypothetical protein [Clostridioides sp. ZZV13-5731]
MFEKFKVLKSWQKILIVIIGILLLPLTLLLFSILFLVKSINKNSNKLVKTLKVVISLFVVFILLMFNWVWWGATLKVATEPNLNEQQEIKRKEEEQDIKDNEVKEKQELKAKEEKDKLEQQKKKELEEKKKQEDLELAQNKKEEKEKAEKLAKENADKSTENAQAPNPKTEESNPTNQKTSETVYANGGKSKSNKYHSSPTAHNMEGAISMSREEAEANGYVACKTCY